ncbi:hypothetical protein KY348_02605 [Candidatus Woesearchaeota archaeon]|nr:hypothetical protein [Candidatus Woesearchaeota archaeon]
MVIIGDINDYKYTDTVFVLGNLMSYVEDLERYFRGSAYQYDYGTEFFQRGLDSLIKSIDSHKKYSAFFWDGNGYDCPFYVDEKNYEQGLEFMKDRMSTIKKIARAQRVNQSNLMRILYDGKSLDSLDLTNYAYPNHIVRITHAVYQQPDKQSQESIRMRVFFNINAGFHTGKAESFADRANHFEGVEAKCVEENDVDESIPSLDSVAGGRIRRSRLQIKNPVFKVVKEESKITYSIQLSDAEVEMLKLCNGFHRPQTLITDSNLWSPHQGKKIMRNLFGILAIEDRGKGYGRHWYAWVGPPSDNIKAIKQAKKNSVFSKSIDIESIPVLANIYNRTLELKNQYSQGFYPYFTPTEIANRTGISKQQVRDHMEQLTGVLAKVYLPYIVANYETYYTATVDKWFIPKSRMNLVKEILN